MGESPPYDQLGGEEGIRDLVNRFYDIMETAPEASGVRTMHAADLGPMREKLFLYLSEWLGGPPVYTASKGSMCLTEAHDPYSIGESERDAWLFCLHRALEESGTSAEIQELLDKPFFGIADFLRND